MNLRFNGAFLQHFAIVDFTQEKKVIGFCISNGCSGTSCQVLGFFLVSGGHTRVSMLQKTDATPLKLYSRHRDI